MLVNNYWFLKKYADETGFSYSTFTTRDIGLVNTSGVGFSISVSTQYGSAITRDAQNFALKNGLTLQIGTGDRPAAITDFALQSPVSVSLSVTISSVVNENGMQTIINARGVNTTGSELIIKEVGIVKTNLEYRDQTAPNYQSALFIRKVLDNPITIPAGSNFTLTYTWDELIEEG